MLRQRSYLGKYGNWTFSQFCVLWFLLRMPDQYERPIAATHWLVDKLLKDLQVAKVLPIKMASLKHQDHLRPLIHIDGTNHNSPQICCVIEPKGAICYLYPKPIYTPSKVTVWWTQPKTWKLPTSSSKRSQISIRRIQKLVHSFLKHHFPLPNVGISIIWSWFWIWPQDAELEFAVPDLSTWLDNAVAVRSQFLESSGMANQLVKRKGTAKKTKKAFIFTQDHWVHDTHMMKKYIYIYM